ncbi:Inositol 1 [Columba guinea]|nr:Inositol 1 [Columba guinea]
MAAAIAFALAVLAVEHILKPEPQTDVATAERMRQREEYLRQEMDQLLREMEWRRSAEETALLSAMQHCLLLGIALVLVLLAVASRLIRRRKLAFENRSEQDSSSRKEEDNEEVKDLNGTHNGVRSLAVSTPLLMQVLPDTCKALQHLVGDLLGVCRMLSKKTFMPQMHPAIGMDGVCESWRVHKNNISYCLLVFLRPPPGHSFSLELDTMGQLPPRHSSIRVALDCVCSSEQLLADSLCFLHHLDDNLARDQSSYLLHTLCTSSCLDVEKLASWVQELVKTAWLFLPQSHHCQLTVLPSHQSCRFQLTSTSQMTIYTEMTFAVQQGSSIIYLSLE